MKKFGKFLLAIAFILPITLGFSGCDDMINTTTTYVVSVTKSKTEGLVDTYTILFSNGTTSQFTVTNGKDGVDGTNGKDGEDATSPTITEIYETYCEKVGEISYADFLALYLKTNTDSSKTITSCLLSSMKIYSEFYETSYRTLKNAVYCGSAVIYEIGSEYTYILTNYHVIYDSSANTDNNGYIAKAIYGYLYGSEGNPTSTKTTDELGYTIYDYGDNAIPITYVGGAATYDIAILKAKTADIKAINPDVKEITFADNYHVGDTVYAVGNTEDEGISVTEGIISVDNESVLLSIDTYRYYRSMRIDAAIYQGNSGGGLFNVNGELVGLTNSGDGDNQNVNYAVPLQIVKNATENILAHLSDTNTNPYKVVLGINGNIKNSKYVYDASTGHAEIQEEIFVSSIVQNSIASEFGLEVGDKLISIIYDNNEIAITRSFTISDLALTFEVGKTVQIKYLRDDTEHLTSTHTLTADDFVKVE